MVRILHWIRCQFFPFQRQKQQRRLKTTTSKNKDDSTDLNNYQPDTPRWRSSKRLDCCTSMPLPLAAATRAASAAGNVGATALGIGMGKTDLELTQELFKLQMRQAKRLWTADYAESSVRHGESCMQSAQQHAEAQAMASAAYFQAEKINSQNIKLARDQDARSYELAFRSEVRESLRDELQNQNNRSAYF